MGEDFEFRPWVVLFLGLWALAWAVLILYPVIRDLAE